MLPKQASVDVVGGNKPELFEKAYRNSKNDFTDDALCSSNDGLLKGTSDENLLTKILKYINNATRDKQGKVLRKEGVSL